MEAKPAHMLADSLHTVVGLHTPITHATWAKNSPSTGCSRLYSLPLKEFQFNRGLYPSRVLNRVLLFSVRGRHFC
ncbi:hypothetical protein M758_UG023800 [Ceratodon purpureus]|nr:hypothetical protein M758_UG023800 [Ceratodon purpureus]